MAVRILLSITSPSTGRIWIVTSRPTSADHATADFCTSTTPPSVTPDKNVMVSIRSTSFRPATERSGTIGAVRFRACGFTTWLVPVSVAYLIERHPAVIELHARIVERIEQRQFVRRKD